jgi:hypothetical protein
MPYFSLDVLLLSISAIIDFDFGLNQSIEHTQLPTKELSKCMKKMKFKVCTKHFYLVFSF